jgi:hypothetical protein
MFPTLQTILVTLSLSDGFDAPVQFIIMNYAMFVACKHVCPLVTQLLRLVEITFVICLPPCFQPVNLYTFINKVQCIKLTVSSD